MSRSSQHSLEKASQMNCDGHNQISIEIRFTSSYLLCSNASALQKYKNRFKFVVLLGFFFFFKHSFNTKYSTVE